MANRRRTDKNSKKVLMIIVGIVVLIVAVAIGIFMSKGKAEESNEDIDIKEPTRIAIEQKVEYGDDIKDKTFTINTEEGEKEEKYADLDPEVDTMIVGKTEHQLELEDESFDVTVIVEDTQKPVIKGVKDVIELEGEEVDVEKELKKLITAEDPVDGELDVVFEIEEDKGKENNYNVTAEAIDENGNKTTERFEVVVKVVVKEEKEEKADKKDEENKSSSVVSKSENDTKPKQEKPKQEEQKQEKPKQEEPKQEKPKQEEPKTEEPKQEKQPTALDTGAPPLKSPSGIPSGATLSQELLPSYHMYSYSRSLPGGGSITAVDVSSDYGGSATMVGTDNDGNNFIASYRVSHDNISYQMIGPMGKPTFTQDDKSLLFEVGRAFTRAYGM